LQLQAPASNIKSFNPEILGAGSLTATAIPPYLAKIYPPAQSGRRLAMQAMSAASQRTFWCGWFFTARAHPLNLLQITPERKSASKQGVPARHPRPVKT
jgi:hypothetical protein